MDESQSSPPAVTTAPTGTSAPLTAPGRSARTTLVWYLFAAVVVVLIGMGLWFVLERDGRVSTGVFDAPLALLKQRQSAAVVNGTSISVHDFESTLRQLTSNVSQQGVDASDPAVAADLRTQALDSLVNTEILRQKAAADEVVVTEEDIAARYTDIETGIGGPEALAARMSELGVTDAMLRRDIENDILIQAHLERILADTTVVVEESEITAFYEQAVAGSPEAPPLEEVREQVEAQLRFEKEQSFVAEYVERLRGESSIELLI